MADKAIKCGKLFDAIGKGCLKENQTIKIDGNKITNIVPTESFIPEEGEKVIDLSDKFVMPGLIDGHVHLQFNSDRGGRSVIYKMSMGEIALKSLAMANLDLQAGFTTVRVMSANGYTDVAVRNSINQGYNKGPRIYASGVPLGCVSGNGDTDFREDIKGGEISMMVNGPYEARAAVRAAIKYGVDQIKLSSATGFLDFGDNTGCPEMTYDELAAATECAHMHHMITAAHTYSAESISNAVRAGVDTIEHCVWVDDDTLNLMKEKGTYMVPTSIVLLLMEQNASVFNITGKRLQNIKDSIDYQKKQVTKAKEMGIKIAFGTDAGTPFNKHGRQALEFQCLVGDGLTEEEALLSATKVNSEMIGMQDQIGSIEVGKLADIVAYDKNPLDDISAMMDCSFVMKDGEIFKGQN